MFIDGVTADRSSRIQQCKGLYSLHNDPKHTAKPGQGFQKEKK